MVGCSPRPAPPRSAEATRLLAEAGVGGAAQRGAVGVGVVAGVAGRGGHAGSCTRGGQCGV